MTLFDIVCGTRRCPACDAHVRLVDGYVIVCEACDWVHADIGAAYVSGRTFEPDRVLDEVAVLERMAARETH
ncbi:MAG: hypothetical protein IT177_00855 [Acidobacteria bacterium]|nr:hypothetical protein [Acidobacteriota bacterium]